MPKTKTARPSKTLNSRAFDASKATDQIRAFAEKGVEQSKEAYAKLKTGAEETQKALESTFETAKTVSSDLSLKTIAALRANAEAGFSHLEALIGAKSLSEVVELQTAFLRKRVETDRRAGQGIPGRGFQGRRRRLQAGQDRLREGPEGTQGRLNSHRSQRRFRRYHQ